jgi:uncharacterized phage protein gp47/JayE
MTTLATKTFNTLVQDCVTAIQSATTSFQDLTIGSILRAVVEASAGVALWLQGLIIQLLSVTRASTSVDSDLDTWCADYGFTRLAASQATGIITFSRFTPTNGSLIPIGARVQSSDGLQNYTVVVDTANPAYSASQGGYIVGSGVFNVDAPVQAVNSGTQANAVIGGVNTLIDVISGIDTVTNAAAIDNGSDAETDDAMRARFVLYVASLSKATKLAVEFAIVSIQDNLSYSITENYLYNDTANMGHFYVVVDDGTGYPTTELLDTVYGAIDAIRPVTVTFSVHAPVVVTVAVNATITTATGYDHGALVALAINTVTDYLNGLGIDADLSYTRLHQVIYDSSDGITNVTGLLLNGATSDIAITNKQTIVAGTVSIL